MSAQLKIADEKLAYALLRTFVGLNVMMHGLSRMVAGLSQFATHLQMQFAHSPLPLWSVQIFGTVLPAAETLLGLFLLIGFKTRAALVGGSLWLLILTFGSSLIQDWQAAGTQLIYALAYALLLFFRRCNALSIDTLRSDA
jgi:thiosulfate dehydrogenase (quinone) large subunit